MRRNKLLATAALVLAAVSAPLASTLAMAAGEKVVRIYFWYEYVPEKVLKAFEAKTGIKVVYDTFESTEMLTTKVLTGKSGYDVVMPTAQVIGQYIAAGAVHKLDAAKLPGVKDLNPDIMTLVATQDPGNAYGLPYAYGTTGIVYNPVKVAKIMPDAPVNSLDMIFKPEIAAKFKKCGLAMIDSPEGVVAVALRYLGFDPYSTDEAEINKAFELLKSVRPNIRHFRTGSIMNEMAQGNLCLALGWSGDAMVAASRAEEAKAGNEVRYAIPKEGTEIFFDMMAIPADAPNAENAHAFMSFVLEPENIAEFTNTVFYPNANTAATPLVEERIRTNPNIYPSKDVTRTLFAAQRRDAKSLRLVTRLWSGFRAGRK
jgi:putrescine transport system substrate-binding protein